MFEFNKSLNKTYKTIEFSNFPLYRPLSVIQNNDNYRYTNEVLDKVVGSETDVKRIMV